MIQPSYIPSTNGLQSYVDASPSYELSPIGIASMQDQAQKLAEMGRNGDIYVIHAAQGETVIPMEVLEANPQIKALLFNQMTEMGLDPQRYVVGDQLNSLNPVTGMPEFFFSSIFKGIKKAVKSVVKVVKKLAPVILPIAAAVFGVPFLGASIAAFGPGAWGSMALANGIGTLIGGGNLKDAFKSAAIGGIGSIIGSGFKGLAATKQLSGFGAGLKAGITGQTPIFNAAGAQVGTQVAPTARATWSKIVGGDPIGGIMDAVTGQGITTYTPEYLASPAGFGAGFQGSGLPEGLSRYVSPPSLAPLPMEKIVKPVTTPDGGPSLLDYPGGQHFGPDGRIISDTPDLGLLGDQTATYTSDIMSDAAPGGSLDRYTLGKPGQGSAEMLDLRPELKSQYLVDRQNILDAAGVGEKAIEPVVDKTPFLGEWSPTVNIAKQFGYPYEDVPAGVANLGDLALGGLGAYGVMKATGGFDEAEEEIVTAADRPDLGGRILTLAEREELAKEQELQQASINPFLFTPSQDVLQPSIFSAAGGSVNYPERDLLVEGPGTEKSDEIPAMLSDGEFVINSRAVRGADPSGKGNRYAGAQNLYNLMRNFEMRA
jgi:hypothetical protein